MPDNSRSKDAPIDTSRRMLALALLGGAGGAALLKGCADDESSLGAETAEERLGSSAQALMGTDFRWFDKIVGTGSEQVLGNTAGSSNGQIAVVAGYHDRDDGGGGIFRWQSDTPLPAGDNGLVFAPNSSGRWVRICSTPDIDVRWFGAQDVALASDVATTTKAFEDALSAAAAKGCACLVPSGTFKVSSVKLNDGAHLRGTHRRASCILAASDSYSGIDAGAPPPSGVIETGAAFSYIMIENLHVDGAHGWSPSNSVVSGARHGILANPSADSSNLQIRDVLVSNVAGHGVCLNEHVFQSRLDSIDCEQTAGNSFDVYGNNTITLHDCSGKNIAAGSAQFRILSGCPLITNCNGLFFGAEAVAGGFNATTHKVTWGRFGDGTAICRPTIIGCNIESFTEYGCHFYAGSCADFFSTNIVHSQPCRARAMRFNNIGADALPMFAATSRVFKSGTADWGGPGSSGTADGVALESVGVPLLPLNSSSFANYTTGTQTIELPYMRSNNLDAIGTYGIEFSTGMFRRQILHTKFVNLDDGTTYPGNAYTIVGDDHMVVFTGTGTINLTRGDTDRQREVLVLNAGTGTGTIDAFGGHKINGADTLVLARKNSFACLISGPVVITDWFAVVHGADLLGSATVDVASIASGASLLSSGVTITGAALGDRVQVSCSVDLQGLLLTGYVSATDTAKFLLANLTGGAIDLGSATYRFKVSK